MCDRRILTDTRAAAAVASLDATDRDKLKDSFSTRGSPPSQCERFRIDRWSGGSILCVDIKYSVGEVYIDDERIAGKDINVETARIAAWLLIPSRLLRREL